MAINVDVPLDMELLRSYQEFKNAISPADSLKGETERRLNDYRSRIEDGIIGKNILYLYEAISNSCRIIQNTLDCSNLDKAINAFEAVLKNKTGREYKIRVIADGNV